MKQVFKAKAEKVKSQPFYATERHQVPSWILKKIADLVNKSTRLHDSSSMLYACLESRNLLELISATKLLCSVPENEREALTLAMKPQHGIENADKNLKALRLKIQEFMSVVSEQANQPFPIFNFSECNKIQGKLSQYVHNYTISESDMLFGSQYIRDGFSIVSEAVAFAKANIVYNPERNTYGIVNVDVPNMPDWAKLLLVDWKSGKIKDRDTLIIAVDEAVEEYISNSGAGD